MKTFDKKDIFTCVNAEDAMSYIGNNGYFADSLSGFNHIDCFAPYSLDEVQIGTDKPFVYRKKSFALFLPNDKVKEIKEPKKYRPFETMEEFIKTVGDIGSIITYRTKKESSHEMKGMFTGYMWDSACRDWIIGLGANLYRLDNLFELAEYKYKNNWRPFGVLENES